MQVVGGHATMCQQHVQHAAAIEPTHLHEPVDDFAIAIDRKGAAGVAGQRTRAEVGTRGEPAIEPYLFTGADAA